MLCCYTSQYMPSVCHYATSLCHMQMPFCHCTRCNPRTKAVYEEFEYTAVFLRWPEREHEEPFSKIQSFSHKIQSNQSMVHAIMTEGGGGRRGVQPELQLQLRHRQCSKDLSVRICSENCMQVGSGGWLLAIYLRHRKIELQLAVVAVAVVVSRSCSLNEPTSKPLAFRTIYMRGLLVSCSVVTCSVVVTCGLQIVDSIVDCIELQ